MHSPRAHLALTSRSLVGKFKLTLHKKASLPAKVKGLDFPLIENANEVGRQPGGGAGVEQAETIIRSRQPNIMVRHLVPANNDNTSGSDDGSVAL